MKKTMSTIGNDESGFSLVELITVVSVIIIVTAVSVPYLYNYKKQYKSEDQCLKVLDLMREASQLATTRRRTMRLEIDKTTNAVLIIDETGPLDATGAPLGVANFALKKIPLEPAFEVRMDTIPAGFSRPNPPNYPDATFATDGVGHVEVNSVSVTGHSVWVARFKSDGSVVTTGNVPLNATLYCFPPVSAASTTPRSTGETRAITVAGGAGAVRYWKPTTSGTFFTAAY